VGELSRGHSEHEAAREANLPHIQADLHITQTCGAVGAVPLFVAYAASHKAYLGTHLTERDINQQHKIVLA
jgi:hypothetical protein